MASIPPDTTFTFWWPYINRLQASREAVILLLSYATTRVSSEMPAACMTLVNFFAEVSILSTGTLITISLFGTFTAPCTWPAA